MQDQEITVRPTTEPSGYVSVAVIVNPFQEERPPSTLVPAGDTLEGIVELFVPDETMRAHVAAFVGGDYVPPHLWGSVRPKAGSSVFMKAVPQDPVSLIALLAPVAGQFVAGSVLGLAVGTLSYALVAAGVTFAILAVGQALFGPSRPDRAPDVAPAFSLSGARNNARPFDAIPVVAGTHRHVPTYGAEPYTEVVGDKQYLRLCMVWGYAPIQLEDVKIGNTPIEDFRNIEIVEDLDGSLEDVGFYPGVVGEEALNIRLETTFVSRTCEVEGDELAIDLFYPAGLGTTDNKGRPVWLNSILEFEYREVGSTSWTPFSIGPGILGFGTNLGSLPGILDLNPWVTYYDPDVGEFVQAVQGAVPPEEVLIQSYTADEVAAANAITGNDGYRVLRAYAAKPLRCSYRVTGLPSGLYEVRVRRVNPESGIAGWREQVNWVALRAIDTSTSPIQKEGFAITYYRLQATDQLNGVVDQLNGIASTLVPLWNGQSWGVTEDPPLVDLKFGEQVYKENNRTKLFDDLFTFSRASDAYFWDASGKLAFAGSNVPRFDYDKDGNARGLMLEDARRQLMPYASHSAIPTSEIASNTTTSDSGVIGPDGINNWIDLTADAVAGFHVWQKQAVSSPVTTGRTYTMSAIVARLGADTVEMRAFSTAVNGVRVLYSLADTTATLTYDAGSSAHVDSGIEEVAPGVFRIWVTATAGAGLTNRLVLLLREPGTNALSFTGDGASGLRLFHLQIEEESSADARGPSSPILNTSASIVERAADVMEYTPPASLDEESYSVLIEASKDGEFARTGYMGLADVNPTLFYTDRDGRVALFTGAKEQIGIPYAEPTVDQFFRAALSYDYGTGTGTTLLSIAGSSGTDTGAGAGNSLRFRTNGNGAFSFGERLQAQDGTVRIKRVAIFNSILTQDELNDLTGGDEPAELGKTSNPAAFYRYVLTGAPNPRPVPRENVDDDALGAWFETCEAEGYQFDLPIVFRSPIRDLLQDVANAGKASPAYVDDKWSVIEEKPRTTVVQHFTPRNTRNFDGALIYPDIPQALRIRFANEEADYQEDERIVYDDGFDESNTTLFEVIDLPGQTNPDNVYRLARHYLAAVRLRPENFTLETDIEHLVATRGDLCRLTHDAAIIGQAWGRIVSLTSSSITLDEPVSLVDGTAYTLRVRTADGDTETFEFTATATETVSTVVVSTTGSSIAAGDMFMFGQNGIETIEVLVRSIEYLDNLDARISLVPYSPAIYNSANAIPPYETNLSDLQSISFTGPPTPEILQVETGENVLVRNTQGGLEPRIVLSVTPGRGSGSNGAVTRTESLQARYRLSDTGEAFSYSPVYPADTPRISLDNVLTGEAYDVQLRAIGPAGEVSAWATEANVTVLGALAKPNPPDTFLLNTIGDYAYLEWTHINPAVDVVGYEIRFHPDQDVTDWQTMAALADEIPANARSFTVPAASGSYAIKTRDVLGGLSETALYINATLTDAAAVRDFLTVATTTENPGWAETKTGTSVNGSNQLQLTADTDGLFEESGTYEFGESDLGMVTTLRIVPKIKTTVINTLNTLDTWDRLADVDPISGESTGDEVKVYLEVAYSRDDVGSGQVYSAWQRVVYGDYTARWVKFRLVLETTVDPLSELSPYSPAVTDLTVDLDLLRTESRGEDITSGAATYSVAFSPDLFQLESVSVTAQNMQTGDYYQISNKTRTGFDIDFFNSAGTNVSRVFDYVAIGYGQENGT